VLEAVESSYVLPRRVERRAGSRPVSGLAPERPLYVVGIVRGQFGAFTALLERIEAESAAPRLAGGRVVLLGDLVWGRESRDLLATLRLADAAADGQLVVLMGRRDRLLLDFLGDPAGAGPEWLRAGGRVLLQELGIGIGPDVTARALRDAASRLQRALGASEIGWLRRRPLFWQSGNLVCVHAALDPFRPLSLQAEAHLLGGHPQFHRVPRRDGRWVVHAEPGAAGGVKRGTRIAVGGGRPEQGRVDAVRIEPGTPPAFFSARAG